MLAAYHLIVARQPEIRRLLSRLAAQKMVPKARCVFSLRINGFSAVRRKKFGSKSGGNGLIRGNWPQKSAYLGGKPDATGAFPFPF